MSDRLESLFQDEQILAIHKPAGIPFHSDDESQGIVQAVRESFESNQLFPVHRLDKMTSGLMVFAKNKKANSELSKLLEAKQIEKYYLALSGKKPNKKQGMVSGDMLKGRRGSFLLSREKTNPAVTRFFAKPLSAFLQESTRALDSKNVWLFILKPETGKTHQLRVALKSLASPIIGDARYGGEASDRGYLHAFKMRFELFGKRYDITDPYFRGARFDLSTTTKDGDLYYPNQMNWPKATYLLGE